jgi:hypothetical protein
LKPLAWQHTPVISGLGRLRHKDHKFKASLGYITKPCLTKKKKRKKEMKLDFISLECGLGLVLCS